MRGFLARAGFVGIGCLGVTRGLGPCIHEEPATNVVAPLVTGVGPPIDELVEIESLACETNPLEPKKRKRKCPVRFDIEPRALAKTSFEHAHEQRLLVAGTPSANPLAIYQQASASAPQGLTLDTVVKGMAIVALGLFIANQWKALKR